MDKYVAILHDGVLTVHLPHTTGNYYTLCGEDGFDDDPSVDSVAADVPEGAKVDCHECKRIWDTCKLFTAKDFAASNTACTRPPPASRKRVKAPTSAAGNASRCASLGDAEYAAPLAGRTTRREMQFAAVL